MKAKCSSEFFKLFIVVFKCIERFSMLSFRALHGWTNHFYLFMLVHKCNCLIDQGVG